MHKIYQNILHKKADGRKQLFLLLDPDKLEKKSTLQIANTANECQVDCILVGGSLIVSLNNLKNILEILRDHTSIPIILFPGSTMHLFPIVDAILFLSLISGRNPEFLIGQHVLSAPIIKEYDLEVISTGYMLVNCGNQTTVSYMSNTFLLPYNKPQIASATALAGEMLGLKLIYLEGGSGAYKPVSTEMIHQVSSEISLPLIVGGGIRTQSQIRSIYQAGADIAILGTLIEEKSEFLFDMIAVRDSLS